MQAGPRLELLPQPLPAHGDLSTTPFAVLLGNARALGASGILEIHEQKRVFFWQGEPVGVRTNFPDEISEVYMLRHGIVAEGDLDRVRRLATTRHSRFGEALLNLGYLEANELFEHTRRHALQNLTTCFRWEQGPFEWTPCQDLGTEIVPVALDLIDVFVTGVSRFYDRHRLDRELPVDEASRVYAKPPPPVPTGGAALGTVDARIFQLAAARPTILSLAHAVGLPDKTVRQRLYVLYCLGYIGFEQEPPKAVTRPISRIATIPAFGSPLPKARRITTPAPIMPPTAIPGRVPTRTMVSAPPRAPIARKPSESVEELLGDAEISRASGQFHVAIATLRSALTLQPDNPAVLGDLALTLMLCEPKLHAREANRLAREARRLDPNLASPYVVMGMLMEQIGEKGRARQLYQYALERDPMCGDAMTCIEKLPPSGKPT